MLLYKTNNFLFFQLVVSSFIFILYFIKYNESLILNDAYANIC
jgi:hypothetical protein